MSWKGDIYSEIDDDFLSFFREDIQRRVPIWGVQWGGVSLDGIPPLENPKHIPAEEATYLEPDDPVFGVSLGGETRAYPCRIMAWHELANDVIGVSPVTFVF